MRILRAYDLIEVPWKNGGGTTREIATGITDQHVVWRISRADVAQDGAFSDFTGFIRILTVVSGGGMVLEHANGTLDAELWDPVRFDGSLRINSRLTKGPLTDLNLMFDPTFCEGDVILRRGPFEQVILRPASGIVAFHVLSGGPTMNAAQLTTGDTAFFDEADAALSLGDGDTMLEIRLRNLDQSDNVKLCIGKR